MNNLFKPVPTVETKPIRNTELQSLIDNYVHYINNEIPELTGAFSATIEACGMQFRVTSASHRGDQVTLYGYFSDNMDSTTLTYDLDGQLTHIDHQPVNN